MYPGVVRAALRMAEQKALLSRFLWIEESLTIEALPISQSLREGLVACLWEQENADDADESATGKDNVVKEITLLIVEVHDGAGQHAKASTGQDQAQTTTPVMRDAKC